MRALPEGFSAYAWAPSTDEIAHLAGVDPHEVLRFDSNLAADPPPSARPGTIAGALARVNTYPPGGSPALVAAIAGYAGVAPDQVVLGAGADDLILLCARTFAGPGDTVAVADDPTYPLFEIAARLAGAEVGGDHPSLTFCCRPNNPTGAFDPLPAARPLAVDEAYFEYAGETAADLLDDGVVVIRTFSKAFGLAGARVGYALADPATAAELRARQAPAPVSTLSAALAVAALADPPDVAPVVAERDRLTAALRALGLDPLPSRANFVLVPLDGAAELADTLLRQGIAVRPFAGAIRISVLDPDDDDVLLAALAGARAGPRRSRPRRPRSRLLRATAETRLRVRLALDGAGRVSVATGAGLYDHLLEQLAFHGGLRPPRRRGRRPARPARTTRPRTRRSRSARRSTARWAIAAGSRGTATRSCRWTTRSPGLQSTSAGGRGGDRRSSSTRASPATCSRASRRPAASRSTSRQPAATSTTSPRRRSRRSAARSGRRPARGRGFPSTKGVL